jgi:pimeloyl-ACP methyl ester carboxylesterase
MAIKGLVDRPWLLLPGTLCTVAVFDGFLDALGVQSSKRHHVQLDRPAIDDYRATFENLSGGTIVCGFSLGAIVAAHFADRMDAQCLILLGINPYPDDPAIAQSRNALAADVKAEGGAAAFQKRISEVHGQAPNKTRAQIYAMAQASEDQIDAQTQLALTRPGALPALAKAQMPVLSLTGSQDTSAPVAQGLIAAQTARQGQFHGLNGLGHFALLEDPDACAKAVIQMMETQHDIV